jgi:CRP/FNR family transcriptional regulator, cyclic AMP receptor protein
VGIDASTSFLRVQGRPIQQVLAECTLFSDCAPSTLGMLAAAGRSRLLAPNELVVAQGSPPRAAFVVDFGVLRVFTGSEQGDEQSLTMVFPGDTVGELGVLQSLPRSASVAAVSRSMVVELPPAALRDAYAADVSIAHALVRQMSNRLRATSERLGDMVVLDLSARLAKFLLSEVRRQLDDLPRRAEIELPFTQAQLGQLLGGARQSINRELSELEIQGLIQFVGRRVTVLDVVGLQQRCSGGG